MAGRGPKGPLYHKQGRSLAPCGRRAAHRLHSRRRPASPRLSSPALRRAAPARDDCHGRGEPTVVAYRRRTHHGARRHHPGPGARPAQRTAREIFPGYAIHLARPCRGLANLAPHWSDVRGKPGRNGNRARSFHPSGASLHPRAVTLCADAAHRARPTTPDYRGNCACHCRAAAGLYFRAALLVAYHRPARSSCRRWSKLPPAIWPAVRSLPRRFADRCVFSCSATFMPTWKRWRRAWPPLPPTTWS